MIETGISYFGSRILRHFRADLEDMAGHGCSYVVHTFSENDARFYASAMDEIVAATQAAGLEAWIDPWGVGGVFGGEAFSDYVAHFAADRQVLSTGRAAPAACPNNPRFRDWMRQWVERAVETGAEVVFWDEPHFFIPAWGRFYEGPLDAWACRCRVCRSLFREQAGYEMPLKLAPEVHAFRQDSLLRFLDEMSRCAQELGARNALCLLPAEEGEAAGLPWDRAAALPAVEIFGTDPYWFFTDEKPDTYVRRHARNVVRQCRLARKKPHIWVQAFMVPEGREEEIGEALRVAADEGAEVLAAWGYDGCGHISSIASARPEVVWEVIGRTYRALRGRP